MTSDPGSATPHKIEPGRAIAWLAKAVERTFSDIDLSLSQYRLLVLLEEQPAVASALADKLVVSRPSVTAVVDGLVARGLVGRTPDPADRRRVTHELTPAGRAVLTEADLAARGVVTRVAEAAGDAATASQAMVGLQAFSAALHRLHSDGVSAWTNPPADVAQATR